MRSFSHTLRLLLAPMPFFALVSCGGMIPSAEVVTLDIGHYVPKGAGTGTGARTPGAVNGRTIEEARFWYEYSPYVKRVIERAGYRCVITNRGYAPTTEPLASHARRAGVIHLNRPDVRDRRGAVIRYASRYHPDRVSAGMVSADYAVWKKAACAVFLHHNSSSDRWRRTCNGVVYYNRRSGAKLAAAVAGTLNQSILNHGMPNNGKNCTTAIRWIPGTAGAGWMNTCDDSGIPAILIETAFLNNPDHARYLAEPSQAVRYAEAIGEGVVSWLRSR